MVTPQLMLHDSVIAVTLLSKWQASIHTCLSYNIHLPFLASVYTIFVNNKIIACLQEVSLKSVISWVNLMS